MQFFRGAPTGRRKELLQDITLAGSRIDAVLTANTGRLGIVAIPWSEAGFRCQKFNGIFHVCFKIGLTCVVTAELSSIWQKWLA